MSIGRLREINHEFEALMLEDVKDELLNNTFWHYEPFSENYWNQEYKIVLCNLEPYGDNTKESEKDRILTLDKFREWLGFGNPTPKFSALFLYCLYKKLHDFTLNEAQLRVLYHQSDELLSVVKHTAYMNLRKEEGWHVNEDKENIYRFLSPGWSLHPKHDISNEPYRLLTLEFIDALEPDIFIISGQTGQDILNRMYEKKIDLKWQGMYNDGKTLFVSIYHPASRMFDYKYIVKKTDEILKGANNDRI
jgi:hypothetical protein